MVKGPGFFFDDVVHALFGFEGEDSGNLWGLGWGFDVEDKVVRVDVLGDGVGANGKFGAHFCNKVCYKIIILIKKKDELYFGFGSIKKQTWLNLLSGRAFQKKEHGLFVLLLLE